MPHLSPISWTSIYLLIIFTTLTIIVKTSYAMPHKNSY